MSVVILDNTEKVAVRPWGAVGTLCVRELVRFFRQKHRVFGAIGQPVIFWLLFGAGLGSSFRLAGTTAGANTTAAGPDYREYFFPGTLVLILLFTAIFATISIIEDRREGFLQSVLVSPIPRWAMVLGKVLGGTCVALVQGLVFLVLGLTLEIHLGPLVIAAVVGWMFLVALALTALGFVMAWRLDSTQGYHALMSVFLLPMWLLSGAFFPAPTGGEWFDQAVGWVMRLNPLTYGLAGMRRIMYWDAPDAVLPAELPSLGLSLAVTAAFAAVMLTAAWQASARRVAGDLL